MSRKCRACKRVIRERDRRDLHVFGSMSEPCQSIPLGACRWCAPGDDDEDVDAMARNDYWEQRISETREAGER